MYSETLPDAASYGQQPIFGIGQLIGGVTQHAFNLTQGSHLGLDEGCSFGNFGTRELLDEATIRAMDFEAYYGKL